MFTRLIERARFVFEHRWTQRHMSEYLDGELERESRLRAQRHLDECPECDELLGSLRAIVTTLADIGGSPGREVAAAVFSNVHARLAEQAGDDGSV